MTPIKTGGWVYLTEYGIYARGDLFRIGNILIAHVNTLSETRNPEKLDEMGEKLWATMETLDIDFMGKVPMKVYISQVFTVHRQLAIGKDGNWIEEKL